MAVLDESKEAAICWLFVGGSDVVGIGDNQTQCPGDGIGGILSSRTGSSPSSALAAKNYASIYCFRQRVLLSC